MGRFSALALVGLCSVALAADLPPAAELKEKIDAPPTQLAQQAQKLRPLVQVKIDELAKKVNDMPPADAAKAWLEVYDAWMGSRQQGRGANVSFNDLLAALPPPPAWEELSKAIAARQPRQNAPEMIREHALRLFGSVLANAPSRQRDLDALTQLLRNGNPNHSQAEALTAAAGEQTPAELVKQFEQRLANWPEIRDDRNSLQVPDLITLAGKEKAAELLRKAAGLRGVELNMSTGSETARLARQIALEEIEKMQSPQWRLASNLNSTKLFEAMRKKFRPADAPPNQGPFNDDYEYRQASAYYLLGLIIEGRTDDAIAHAKQLPTGLADISYSALTELENGGHTDTVQAFLHKLLSENPDLPLWDNYVSLSAKTGRTAEMLELARKSAAREGLDANQRTQIRRQLGKALLAADQAEEGIKVLRESIEGSVDFDTAMLLARVGKLLKQQQLVDDSIGSAKKLIDDKIREGGVSRNYDIWDNVKKLASLMEQSGRSVEAVDLIAATLAANKPPPNQGNAPDMDLAQKLGTELVGIYHRAGKHADVLAILQTMPLWQGSDLAQIHTATDSTETPLGYMAAAALADAGRTDEAKKILTALLDAQGGYDPAYEPLIKIDGERAIPRFDEIFSRDQFEERPLIWKGILLVQQNKLDDADKVIKQAIAIDPSDGEQGKGTRMRVYSVLADILEKKGDAEQAKIFRGAVKAIRTAEDADDWWEAGLLTRAIKQYEQALTYFQDAYCIQSRLALRMAEMGFTEKAEEHYRKAYELMPDSFGRMESHCFGCEGAFRGESARKIAEQVFARLIEKNPNKPQLHYLLGYLREQQGRYGEALEPMKAAVKLDPDYLNAWKHIQSLASHIYLPAELRDEAALNLLRLDPLGRHVSASVENVRDFRKLWEVAIGASKVQIDPPGPLLALARAEGAEPPTYMVPQKPAKSPGQMIGRTKTMSTIAQVIEHN